VGGGREGGRDTDTQTHRQGGRHTHTHTHTHTHRERERERERGGWGSGDFLCQLAGALPMCVPIHHGHRAPKQQLLAAPAQVFESKEWDALMGRSILPKLAWALDNRFAVNPIQQDLTAWNSVMAWSGVMTNALLAGLLESRFFPKWHAVLHIWLSNMPDYDEVTAWYRGWKVCLPLPSLPPTRPLLLHG
jgi:hypothetical protein